MKTAKTVLITGTSTGFGRDTAETLGRAGHTVYASMRDITGRNRTHAEAVRALGPKVVELDVTDDASVDSAIDAILAEAGRLDVLINNAGVAIFDDLSDRAVLEEHFAVNLFGPWSVTQATLPLLMRSRGAIVNVLSLASVAAVPLTPSYSAAKAAAWSLSQSLRALLASRGVGVHAVLAGPIDTEMSRGIPVPKASTESVARAIFDAVQAGEDEIFPDPMSATLAESWRTGAVKELERQNAALVAADPIAA
jgi:NAD(P)-dependent dehydrogenase (short-subunit alcohol dehydrogenase family)